MLTRHVFTHKTDPPSFDCLAFLLLLLTVAWQYAFNPPRRISQKGYTPNSLGSWVGSHGGTMDGVHKDTEQSIEEQDGQQNNIIGHDPRSI